MEIKSGQIPPSMAACTGGGAQPSSSLKLNTVRPEPKAVVSKESVTIKKDSAMKKFLKMFIADNATDIKTHLTKNVVVPAIKNCISDFVTSAVNMTLFGQKGKPGTPNWGPSWFNKGFNYSSIYSGNGGNSQQVQPLVNVTDLDNLLYKSYEAAYRVYVGLCSYISNYNCATIHNLYSLSGQVCTEAVADNWGWYQIDNYSIDLVSYGGETYYKLTLPPAISLPKR